MYTNIRAYEFEVFSEEFAKAFQRHDYVILFGKHSLISKDGLYRKRMCLFFFIEKLDRVPCRKIKLFRESFRDRDFIFCEIDIRRDEIHLVNSSDIRGIDQDALFIEVSVFIVSGNIECRSVSGKHCLVMRRKAFEIRFCQTVIRGYDHVTVTEHGKERGFQDVSYRVAHIECHHAGKRTDQDAKYQHDRSKRLGKHILQCVFKYYSHFLTFILLFSFVPGAMTSPPPFS